MELKENLWFISMITLRLMERWLRKVMFSVLTMLLLRLVKKPLNLKKPRCWEFVDLHGLLEWSLSRFARKVSSIFLKFPVFLSRFMSIPLLIHCSSSHSNAIQKPHFQVSFSKLSCELSIPCSTFRLFSNISQKGRSLLTNR